MVWKYISIPLLLARLGFFARRRYDGPCNKLFKEKYLRWILLVICRFQHPYFEHIPFYGFHDSITISRNTEFFPVFEKSIQETTRWTKLKRSYENTFSVSILSRKEAIQDRLIIYAYKKKLRMIKVTSSPDLGSFEITIIRNIISY